MVVQETIHADNSMMICAVIAVIGIVISGLMLWQYNRQQSKLTFYEEQGFFVYPGSRRPLIGMVPEIRTYMQERESENLVEFELSWFYKNVHRFVNKGEVVPEWRGNYQRYMFGLHMVFISDPEAIQDLKANNQYIDKHSHLGEFVYSPRLRNTVYTLARSSDQGQRRRTFINFFRGNDHFKILDQSIKQVLNEQFQIWKESKEIDLRRSIYEIFVNTMTTYLYGRDVKDKRITMKVLKEDGSVIMESMRLFEAMDHCFNTGMKAMIGRLVFGDKQITKAVQVTFENWEIFCAVIDKLVLQQLNAKEMNKGEEKEAECLMDLMLQSDAYKDDVEKISNDMIISMIGGTDTSRNTTITSLCHLTKSKLSREKVRAEIDQKMAQHGVQNVLDMTHKHIKLAELEYLQMVIYECLRFNPPVPNTEEFRFTQDCKLGKFNFKANDACSFFVYGCHHNPAQWHTPNKFIVERFDPNSKFYKKPNGEPRHEDAFIPFSFGERSCTGQMFAKQIIPTFVTKVIKSFDLEFIDEHMYDEDWYPTASFLQNYQPPIRVKVNPKF